MTGAALARFDETEMRLCRYLNRTSSQRLTRAFFTAVSRLGDGWAWYALLAEPTSLARPDRL